MAKKCVLFAVAVLICLSMSGCWTLGQSEFTYDETLPPEKTAFMIFSKGVTVVEYNGIAVGDAWYPKGRWRVNKVTLPAGETSILFDYAIKIEGVATIVRVTGKNIEFKYHLEAGKEYTLVSYIKRINLLKTEFGVALWDCASLTPSAVHGGTMLQSWKLGET